METRSGFVDVGGARLYYESRGEGPALLFVHGFSLDQRMWRRQAEALAGLRVVTVDLRGFGRSSPLGEAPFRHADDLAALVDALALPPVVVVGHSIGALYALELCASRPERVAGLAALCASGLGRPPFPPELVELFAAVRAEARGGALDRAKARWGRSGWFASARESAALGGELDQMLADYSGWHWTHDVPSRNLEPPVVDRLASVQVPALVVDGARDLPYNHAVAEVLVAGLPNAMLVRLPWAGHMAPMEAPDEINRALAQLAARAFSGPRAGA